MEGHKLTKMLFLMLTMDDMSNGFNLFPLNCFPLGYVGKNCRFYRLLMCWICQESYFTSIHDGACMYTSPDLYMRNNQSQLLPDQDLRNKWTLKLAQPKKAKDIET